MAKFLMGEILVAEQVQKCVAEEDQMICLNRHAQCDWGDIDLAIKELNEKALLEGGQALYSAYNNGTGVKLYIITTPERDKTMLTIQQVRD
ncbi:hypothetical protein [Brevibacillus choshinensis]|uniref:Uncharacterized protein n=1 Tax=Brevibacillus choshinensis TaxID=54911 RepID=A0ABX7FNB7_BRECH|nr:hypothetical protein [Brevibacillus choshinensis]QRG67723.1 hypothetical protein JNE38_00310 [Brevibacillus choshinensis]